MQNKDTKLLTVATLPCSSIGTASQSFAFVEPDINPLFPPATSHSQGSLNSNSVLPPILNGSRTHHQWTHIHGSSDPGVPTNGEQAWFVGCVCDAAVVRSRKNSGVWACEYRKHTHTRTHAFAHTGYIWMHACTHT